MNDATFLYGNLTTYLGFHTGQHSRFRQNHQGSLFVHHRADFERYTVMIQGRELKEQRKVMQ